MDKKSFDKEMKSTIKFMETQLREIKQELKRVDSEYKFKMINNCNNSLYRAYVEFDRLLRNYKP